MQQGIDWRRASRINSLRVFRDAPLTHAFNGPSGQIEAVALMHADALGPSRLVHARQMLKLFPDGFTFFVPERTAAFVVASTASPDVVAKIQQIVEEVFAAADVPMSKSGYGHEPLIAALTQADEP